MGAAASRPIAKDTIVPMVQQASIHASAVLIGARAALIRGPAGSGKSRLVLALIDAGRAGLLPFARLVADDRAYVTAANGRLLVRPVDKLAGLIEVRGLGLRRLPFERVAVVGAVIDLGAADADRLPRSGTAVIDGIALPRLAVGADPFPAVLAMVATADAGLRELPESGRHISEGLFGELLRKSWLTAI